MKELVDEGVDVDPDLKEAVPEVVGGGGDVSDPAFATAFATLEKGAGRVLREERSVHELEEKLRELFLRSLKAEQYRMKLA